VYFCDADIRSTGTGVFNPFLRVQRDGDQQDGTPSTFSSGWNTDANSNDLVNPPANDFDASQSNALAVGDIKTSNPPPAPLTPYDVFTVDINQCGQDSRGR
jgi:hypothetical protein